MIADAAVHALASELRARLAATAGQPVPFMSDMREDAAEGGTPAAVLIAVTARREPGLILTLRPTTMRRHAGQVAFPGGRIDPGDADAIAAALREAHEEIALLPASVSVAGVLGDYRTVTGYAITPVLAAVAPNQAFVEQPHEVDAVFEVPLAFVLDPRNRREQQVEHDGAVRCYIEITYGDRRIWGATAAMLVNLAARLT